ncbi:MAG: hypothetical protein H6573_33365 [Lewinellaceae bacterium]|nr:hypothetical protein [Lewinellaceae bacterium]
MKEMGIAINELHHKAMALADEASYAKRGGELEVAQSKYLEAFEFEKAAAKMWKVNCPTGVEVPQGFREKVADNSHACA